MKNQLILVSQFSHQCTNYLADQLSKIIKRKEKKCSYKNYRLAVIPTQQQVTQKCHPAREHSILDPPKTQVSIFTAKSLGLERKLAGKGHETVAVHQTTNKNTKVNKGRGAPRVQREPCLSSIKCFGEIELQRTGITVVALTDTRAPLSGLNSTKWKSSLPSSNILEPRVEVSNSAMRVGKSIPIDFQLGEIKGTQTLL